MVMARSFDQRSASKGADAIPTLAFVPTDLDGTAAEARELIASHGLVLIRGVPIDLPLFLAICERFGAPMLRSASNTLPESRYVGNVCVRTEIPLAQRLPTQGNLPLPPHTARAYERVRPALFALLMVNPGWLGAGLGQSGETILAGWSDVVALLRATSPTADEEIEVLMSTPVQYKPWYATTDAAHEPILARSPKGHILARYWEDMLASMAEQSAPFVAALKRFDVVLQDPRAQHRWNLATGDLLLLDNQRVAHGRCGFPLLTPAGSANSRLVWTIHLG